MKGIVSSKILWSTVVVLDLIYLTSSTVKLCINGKRLLYREQAIVCFIGKKQFF
jgi:hypothetical protein